MKRTLFDKWQHSTQVLLYCFVAVAIVWRGGKSIDATWALAGVSFLVVTCSHLHSKPKQPLPWTLWLPSIGIIVWSWLSYAFSQTANYGVDEVLRIHALLLLFLWAVRYIQQDEHKLYQTGVTQFVRVVSITTLFASAIGFIVYVFQPVNRFVGSFFDIRFHTDYWPNAWASFVLLCWPIVYYWVLAHWKPEATRAQRITSFGMRGSVLAVVLASLFLSFSRGGIIAFSGQIVLWAGIQYVQRTHQTKWLHSITGCIGILAAAICIFAFANTARSTVYDVVTVTEKVTFTADEGTSSASERSAFWRDAFLLSLEKPLFGWGPYSFRFIQPQKQTAVLATSDHPHNVFLKMAMETGWPTALLFLFLLLSILLRIVDTILQSNQQASEFSTLLLLSIAGVLSHSLIDYNLQFVGIALLFWLMLGFLAGGTVRPRDRAVPVVINSTVELVLAGFLLIVALYEGIFLATSSLGRHADAAGDTRKAMVWYERSTPGNFSRDLHLSRTNIFIGKQQYTTAEKTLWDYFAQNAYDARAWKLQGDVYTGMQQYTKALQAYETAYAYGKYNDIGITHNLILSYIRNNQRTVVDTKKAEFDALLEQYSTAILLNTHFIALSSNVEHFIELCELFMELYPDDAPVYIVLAAKADNHARIERERLASRPPGFLW